MTKILCRRAHVSLSLRPKLTTGVSVTRLQTLHTAPLTPSLTEKLLILKKDCQLGAEIRVRGVRRGGRRGVRGSRSRGRSRGRGQGGRVRQRGGVFADIIVGPANNIQPNIPDFAGDPGLKQHPKGDKGIDFFDLFINDTLMNLQVQETNRYAQQTLQQMQTAPGGMKKSCRFAAWMESNLLEVQQFLGLTLLMGIAMKPTTELYWTKQPLLSTPSFSLVMTRN